MIVGIMQPYFFPYLAYWQLINAVDKFVLFDDVNYIKRGWINRNNILLDKKKYLITLPLEGVSQNKLINEIRIVSDEKQRRKVLQTIESAYKKAPYFEEIMPMIEKNIMSCDTISELNYATIKDVICYLEISTEIILSSDLNKNNDLKGQDKIIHIAELLGADMYINSIGGTELYNKSDFARRGIQLRFLEMGDINYKQFTDIFVPGLSMIDILMFNSKGGIHSMLNKYTLVEG